MSNENNNIYDNLPQELIKTIAEYIPRDRDMKSPSSDCIRHLIRCYNYYAGENRFYIHEKGHPLRNVEFDIEPDLYKKPWFDDYENGYMAYPDNEDFDDYCLRLINS